MEKTIYNCYVPMESQEQADRMKQVCLDNQLPIWKVMKAFEYMDEYNNYFTQSDQDDDFLIWVNGVDERAIINKTKVSESEWLELLANHLELKVNQS